MKPQHIYTKEEAADLRAKIISSEIVPRVKLAFSKYIQLRSAMLLVAQYWDDEASDAVHYIIIFSVLQTPAWGREFLKNDYDDEDPVNLPGLPSLYEITDYLWEYFYQFEDGEYSWDANGNAMLTFAAYSKEGCHQDMEYLDIYTPYSVFRRKEEEIEIEVVGHMLRPWLDGLQYDYSG
jgi:hypothetical protein